MDVNGSIRILHLSDLHLGESAAPVDQPGLMERDEYLRSLRKMASLAAEVHPDVIAVVGDLFDSNYVAPRVADLALEELSKMAVPVAILPGNHDSIAPESIYWKVDLPRYVPSVRVFTQTQGETLVFPDHDLAIWGRPAERYGADVRPLAQIPARGPERWQVALAHGLYVGKERLAHRSFQISRDEVATSGRDYIALGHRDDFEVISVGSVKVCYSGSWTRMGTCAIVDLDRENGVQVASYGVGI